MLEYEAFVCGDYVCHTTCLDCHKRLVVRSSEYLNLLADTNKAKLKRTHKAQNQECEKEEGKWLEEKLK